ncbi:hypothetical protein FAZ95_08225 [Trinickia violacea]|uniref:Uncharacterized protein n=1 Tax=Trinickia violacea TaxID=2571746 RepID=A0A4P8INP2_9BURK|nr:hypothetical protein [Trinickia violacea]QCP49165.1 hypothetical protein FAZ95_08225 [Trinickia violacea]
MTMPMLAAAGPTSGSGGTITFIGSIVEPGFDISSAPIGPAAKGGALEAIRTSNGVQLTFAAPNGGVPGADVSFVANDAARSTIGPNVKDDVVTRFVDPKGRAFPWQPGGSYHLSPEGGVLSLTVPHGGPQTAAKPVTMVMSYN